MTRASSGRQRRSSSSRKTRTTRSRRYATAAGVPLGTRKRRSAKAKPDSRLKLPGLSAVRVFALLALAGLTVLLVFFFVDDGFYVQAAEISGLQYSDQNEVARQAGVNGFSLFWVNSQEAEARIETLPFVRRAAVHPVLPNRVRIEIEERTPVAVWMMGGRAFWVDREGVALPVAGQLDGLAKLQDLDGSSLQEDGQVDPQLIAALLELQQKLPDVQQFAFDKVHGLSFLSAAGTTVLLGDPLGLAERVRTYFVLANSLVQQGQRASQIDLRYEGGYTYRLAQ